MPALACQGADSLQNGKVEQLKQSVQSQHTMTQDCRRGRLVLIENMAILCSDSPTLMWRHAMLLSDMHDTLRNCCLSTLLC